MQREQKNADNGGQDTKASKGVKKTPDTRLVQLNLQSIPASVKKATVSDRLPQKKNQEQVAPIVNPPVAPRTALTNSKLYKMAFLT